ncbi:MAG: GNAT family N-acetyltransferase [Pseudomonadota bacterium]
MARVVVPDRDSADRLAGIAAAALEGGAIDWPRAAFLDLGGPPHSAVIVDDAFRDGLLIMQMAADQAEILTVGVRPAARRRGLGRDLLQAAEALARTRRMAAMFLEVAVDNAPARALYAAAGWETVGGRRAYYLRSDGARVDALVLRRTLARPASGHRSGGLQREG